jgi:hypothetical protein
MLLGRIIKERFSHNFKVLPKIYLLYRKFKIIKSIDCFLKLNKMNVCVLHLFWLDLFCLSCVEKERKEEKRKNKSQTPPLSFSSSPTRPTFFLYTPRPTFSLPLFYFFPALPEQAASPTCSSGPTATAGPLHPLPLSLSLTSRPHP